jgi:ubiquinone/menaquinone biosynthesis C-methylase UbiE
LGQIVKNTWYENFFDDIYVDYQVERTNVKEICDYLLNQFEVEPGALIFEQCCGIADISRALAQRGYQIIGIDLSTDCIERACQLAKPVSSYCSYRRADALQFITNQPVDAAFNWYTSFGYTDNDHINCQMIKNAYASLKDGGIYVLDYTNPAYILQNFKPYLEVKLKDRPGKIIKEVEIDMERGMIVTYWHYDFPDLGDSKITKFGESKIYFPSMLKEMFLQTGFTDIKLHGSINGEGVTKDSPRNIIVGRK